MTLNVNWKKFLVIAVDVVLAIYLIMAVTSWNTPAESAVLCSKVAINIADEKENGFLTVNELRSMLESKGLFPISTPIGEVNPRNIEDQLKKMPFVKTAQCYATTDGHVTITITQRTPIFRVKNSVGEDYYVDENGGIMPNSEYTSDMVIVTGKVSRRFARDYISILAQVLIDDDLWRNQIVQINVLPDNTIELVPRVGEHIVNIGMLPASNNPVRRAEDVRTYVNKQLHRLEIFYRYGLSNSGWNKYDYISLEFLNQVVCRKSEATINHQKAMEAPAITEDEMTQSQNTTE